MKTIPFLAAIILLIIFAAICLPAISPIFSLVLYGSLWIMLQFGYIQKFLDDTGIAIGKTKKNLYIEPIISALPKVKIACLYLCGYAILLTASKLTPFLTPFYWGFRESDRFWLFHIAVLVLIVFSSQLSAEHGKMKTALLIAVLILFISPTFLEKRIWHIRKGSTITYNIPEYAAQTWVHWHWDINDGVDTPPFQIKLNDGPWFENGKIPQGYKYGGDEQLKTISIRTKPVDEYDVKIEIWPSLTP